MENQMSRVAHLRAVVLGITILVLTLLPPSGINASSPDALLITCIATGGTSAADEYVVIEGVGAGGTGIADYELIYTTTSGATTRRLASLEGAAPLAAGVRLLVANSLGAFSDGAFATWSEGIAATGGAISLRLRANPALIADAVAWGSAAPGAGGFGTPAPTMSSTTMIERQRGAERALIDTRHNSADFTLVPLAPPNLAPEAPGTPLPSPTASPTPTEGLEALTPTEIRTLSLNSSVTVRGTVSAAPGELAEERLYCIEDADSGIGVFVLAQSGDTDLVRGDVVTITGALILRRQALTLVASTVAQIVGSAEPHAARAVDPPAPGAWVWEPWEARAIEVQGVVSGSSKALAGGSRSVTLRLPGRGEILVGVAPEVLTELPVGLLTSKQALRVRGVLHQRAGTSGGGYRLWALAVAADLTVTPRTSLEVAIEGQATPGAEEIVPRLGMGTPSIATPVGHQAWWAPQVAQALRVRGGSLALAGVEGAGLVVLPVCSEAQAVPGGIRAGGMVDRAGRAPYPQPW